ncbi:antibiotic biosynthesis monooxygenase family protein [Acidisoma cladoniae]|uniref:antibiotic biosynthesis monooxygenase family protein n=1 Tax=Acidisoma cladoniae TaxID=3040935 RepID=UPI00254D2017|nr:antibiotic biosynthesis monooxygenase [Acidisoma sp. PAMC 29798]
MFVAMNRFRVIKTEVSAFEARWVDRDSQLHTVPGFLSFNLLKGPEREDHILYASHTIWASHAEFEAWTKSEAFRVAHAGAGGAKPLTLGHPEFEGFETVGGAERG